eukprot:CAMPEP_0185757088 /NCGR_PEP_ID=MMETSP1174-20130828/15537_1 /TAXON_ID=35687 /ORGANISM="Dictyocha speculum, Strain CCMP1381" /LENGTH=160 /DNA_ID=CAMNT_0028436359 /DNA_START=121 /DNA_END=600 /DNA_ORIENTATION=-
MQGGDHAAELFVRDGDVRIDAWVSKHLGITRSRVSKAAKAGMILVDGKPCKPSFKLRAGQTVTYQDAETPALKVSPEDLRLCDHSLFEDEWLIVLDKPSGMATHPAGGLVSGTLVNGLLYHLDQPPTEIQVPQDEPSPLSCPALGTGDSSETNVDAGSHH